jgi:hypothetical protein
MGRLLAVVASVGVLVSVGLQAQQSALRVAGKWEVTVGGQPPRILELTLEGSVVKGTITKAGSTDTLPVTGEHRKFELTFWTPEKEEVFGVMVREGSPVQGTYVHCIKDQCWKSAVTMKRPANAR